MFILHDCFDRLSVGHASKGINLSFEGFVFSLNSSILIVISLQNVLQNLLCPFVNFLIFLASPSLFIVIFIPSQILRLYQQFKRARKRYLKSEINGQIDKQIDIIYSYSGAEGTGNKTGFIFLGFTLIFIEKCLQLYNAKHYFPVQITSGSYPAYFNEFQTHTEK